jgi:hypothetical protein
MLRIAPIAIVIWPAADAIPEATPINFY